MQFTVRDEWPLGLQILMIQHLRTRGVSPTGASSLQQRESAGVFIQSSNFNQNPSVKLDQPNIVT